MSVTDCGSLGWRVCVFGEAFGARTKARTKLSDSQRPSVTFNPRESTEPDLSA
jgi:hypothetical protein